MTKTNPLLKILRPYHTGYNDGLKTGSRTTLNMVKSMLEREQYRNKGEDQYYDYALNAIIKKIEELNA